MFTSNGSVPGGSGTEGRDGGGGKPGAPTGVPADNGEAADFFFLDMFLWSLIARGPGFHASAPEYDRTVSWSEMIVQGQPASLALNGQRNQTRKCAGEFRHIR